MKSIKIAFYFLILITCSCTFSRYNKEEDKKDGIKVVNEFYSCLKTKDYQKLNSFMSREFYEVISFSRLTKFLVEQDSLMGKLQEYQLKDWKTTNVKGQGSQTQYDFVFVCKRQKQITIEALELLKNDKNPEPRIVHYNVNKQF